MSAAAITVRMPLAIRRRPGRKTIVTPTGEIAAPVRTRADPALLKALARAFRWQKMLDSGRYCSISEMARAEKIERGYLGKLLKLTLLAPWAVEAIVDGRQGPEVSLPGLLEGVEVVWARSARPAIGQHFGCNVREPGSLRGIRTSVASPLVSSAGQIAATYILEPRLEK